jgi:RimJ/RimL family protein N-acetyltransferase
MAGETSARVISVRRIRIHEGAVYRKVRLAALSESPDAFSTTLESANSRSLDSWNEQADNAADGADRMIILVFSDEEPVGLAGLYRDPLNKDCGELIQVWVGPDHRGGHAAAKLIEAVLVFATEHRFKQLSAWVNEGNDRAIRFYGKHGFELTDETEPFRPGSDLVSRLMTTQISG